MNKFLRNICILILLGFVSGGKLAAQDKPIDLLRSDRNDYVMVAAHRGDWIYAPENSMESLEHAIHFGADLLETDVRLTKDGHFVMMHDKAVDRTTFGTGNIIDLTLEEVRQLRLKTNFGTRTQMQVPTLEEYIRAAKGRILLYLDKAGQEDHPDHPKGYKIKKLIEVLERNGVLEESVFVLNFPYAEAKAIFGSSLERVNYIPVIEESIPNLPAYVDEYIEKLHPVAFQFRMSSLDSETYRQLPKVIQAGAKPFVAATWKTHTGGHDDLVSIFDNPSKGWGWLIEQGFRILETNYPKDLTDYLNHEGLH